MIESLKEFRKIGILGGTFNPIHIGHLHIGQEALNYYGLDKVVFLPTGTVPHKDNSNILLNEHRLKLTELSIEDNLDFCCWSTEINREKTTYTIDTLKELRELIGWKVEVYYIVGYDVINTIDTWKNIDEIHKYTKFIAFSRIENIDVDYKIKELQEKFSLDISVMRIKNLDISSSDIRESFKYNMDTRYLLNQKAYKYIKENSLYENKKEFFTGDELIDKIKNRLKSTLSKERYNHSISTAKMAEEMANKNGLNVKDVIIAALLHDVGKEFSNEECEIYMKKYNIPGYMSYKENRYMLHGAIAHFIAKEEYHIQNIDILNSIYYHTTGRWGMTLMERIIYLADKIELSRKGNFLDEHRWNYEKFGVNYALEKYMLANIEYLKSKNWINKDNLEVYRYIKEIVNG